MSILFAPIYSALWAQVSGVRGFANMARRVRHWDDVLPSEQPFLCMAETGAKGQVKAHATPTIWELRADFHIYAQNSDLYVSPSEILNPLIDAVMAALAPDPATKLLQLGLPLMVRHAYIEGAVETDGGRLGNQAVAIIPVVILAV